MNLILLNILWLLFGGVLIPLAYFTLGFALCLTVIGIPWGVQLFKLGLLALFPFGSQMPLRPDDRRNDSVNALLNIAWLLLGGLWILLFHLVMGLVLVVSIIGIPFGVQHFKLARLAIWPFGHQVV